MYEQIVTIDRMENAVSLFGSFDENIRNIEKEYSVSVNTTDFNNLYNNEQILTEIETFFQK